MSEPLEPTTDDLRRRIAQLEGRVRGLEAENTILKRGLEQALAHLEALNPNPQKSCPTT